ncbi:MAG: type II toxin-antitoxin system VapC family toxin [Planctomycetaceae bacterium]
MNLLLDTHVVLWWLDDPALLSSAARTAIADPQNMVFVSAAVAWEIAIKRALGKLTSPPDFETAMQVSGFQPLPITITHALAAGGLPPHHRDPTRPYANRSITTRGMYAGVSRSEHRSRQCHNDSRIALPFPAHRRGE